jgi:predicted phosphodiesterase
MKLALLIPDTHRPYHDKKAYKLMIHAVSQLKIDEIVVLGDYADFYAVSSHGRDPRVAQMLVEEIDDVNAGLDELDALFPAAKKIFIEGNHEYRLERYLMNQAPGLFGVTDTRSILKLNSRPNWGFVSYGPNQAYKVLGSKLYARHEPLGRTSEMTARKAMCSVTFGHIHRIQLNSAVAMDGSQHTAFCCGWLGDKKQNMIFDYVKTHHDWQLGFSLVYVDENTGQFYPVIVPISDNYTCVVNGRGYKITK